MFFIPIVGIPIGLLAIASSAAMMFVNPSVGMALLFVAIL